MTWIQDAEASIVEAGFTADDVASIRIGHRELWGMPGVTSPHFHVLLRSDIELYKRVMEKDGIDIRMREREVSFRHGDTEFCVHDFNTNTVKAAYFCGVPLGVKAGHYCTPNNGTRSPWADVSGSYPLADYHPDYDPLRRSSPIAQPEGEFVHEQRDGWTCLAAWDRSADPRSGCTMTFALWALLSPEQALAEVRLRWPQLIERVEKHIKRAVTVRPKE